MIFKTQLWCSNSFKQGLICVNEGEDEYKKYINEQLNSVTSDESYKSYSNFSKTFGNLKIMISNDYLINNNDESLIYIDINLEDTPYISVEEFSKLLKNDKELKELLEKLVIDYINNINEHCKSVVIPVHEDIIFKNNRVHIISSENNTDYKVEWTPFTIDVNSIYIDEIYDYLEDLS